MINSEDEVPIDDAALERILRGGGRGALALAGTATAIVILIWIAFYLLVFAPRATP